MHLAVISNKPMIAKMLLEAGADNNTADMDGRTPFDFATSKEMLNILAKYNTNWTPLYTAAYNGNVAEVKNLIWINENDGIDINVTH